MHDFMRQFKFKKQKKREFSLDFVKGVAVLTMIMAHSVAFFSNASTPTLSLLQKFGDTVSFTMFFFASAGSIYLAYLNCSDEDFIKIKAKKIKKRLLNLVLLYYVVAFISSLRYIETSFFGILKHIIKILFFLDLPGYTEFLLPFIFFSILTLVFYKSFRKLAQNFFVSLIFGIFLFFVGSYLSTITVNSVLYPIKIILFGQNGIYSFPLFQYAIVFFLGLNFGYILTRISNIKIRSALSLRYLMLFIFAFLGYSLFEVYYLSEQFAFKKFQQRWPPSLAFISLGLALTYVLLTLFVQIKKEKIKNLALKFLKFFGKNVFLFYFVHITILLFYELLHGPRIDSVIWVGFMFFLLLVLVTLLIIFYKSAIKEIQYADRVNKTEEVTTSTSLSFRAKLLFGIPIVIIISAIFYSRINVKSTQNQQVEVINIDIEHVVNDYTWWDDFSPYKRVIIVKNNKNQKISKNQTASFRFNHHNLVEANKSLKNGYDLKLVYFDNNEYQEVPIKIFDPNSVSTQVVFKLIKDIDTGKDDRDYFLYYGDLNTKTYVQDQSLNFYADIKSIQMSQEILHPLIGSVNRMWVLKGKELEQSKTSFKFFVTPNQQNELYDLSYTILGTNIIGEMKYNADAGIYEANLDTGILLPGEYKIQAKSFDEKNISSSVAFFKVSYPVYVVWTIDWEGYATQEKYLNMMNDVANKHKIPFTHFYNPRIYVANNISKSNTDMTDNWIKWRQENYGDEIGLHLHGFYDMDRAAGVSVKTSNRWGGYTDGKDVPMTEFSEDEMVRIFNWAKSELSKRGFDNIYSYRGGAWFVNLDALRALEKTGFKIDSSGRDYYKWGPNKVEGFWNLDYTTKPYRPNVYDQNSSAQPNFLIWEFPNNGGDSWNNSTDEMIHRFDLNYNRNSIAEERITVNYLSHPHWFNVDEPKIDAVFDYIDTFLYENDQGPVLYVTLQDAAKGWGVYY